jgi:glycolate oxidase iron-sulfur subunit
MHAHLGFLSDASDREEDLRKAYPGQNPIIVNSAGCGSAMKEGPLASRTIDLSEFLAQVGFENYLADKARFEGVGAYHDACHLAHGQGIREEPRRLLQAINGVRWVDLDESDMCCGSAGVYNVTQPTMARKLLDRKWTNIEKSGASFVVLANPGCQTWIAQAGRENGDKIPIYHVAEILEASLSQIKLD